MQSCGGVLLELSTQRAAVATSDGRRRKEGGIAELSGGHTAQLRAPQQRLSAWPVS